MGLTYYYKIIDIIIRDGVLFLVKRRFHSDLLDSELFLLVNIYLSFHFLSYFIRISNVSTHR